MTPEMQAARAQIWHRETQPRRRQMQAARDVGIALQDAATTARMRAAQQE
jgi:hypothetical protein